MPKPLVIVESPAKARTISGFLGPDYLVESSIGHIRDLPRNASEIPAAKKGEPWARLGVDVEHDFAPLYVVAPEKRAQVAKLRSLLKEASELYLATDEDREGESIAWHLLEVLAPRVPVRRMVFHEITRAAIERAVQETRDLDRRLVDAQEARRILDRLYGYEISPVLWKKVMPRLSAGRVQSVATRLLVERERARMRFVSATWWGLEARVEEPAPGLVANLVALDGRRVATGRDFDSAGRLADVEAVIVLDEPTATSLAAAAAGGTLVVSGLEEKPFRRSPYPPFMTSTLQQEAGRKLRFGAQRTMATAQRLYEAGYITYMRTDSVQLSDAAISAARAQATALFGPDAVPETPRRHRAKVRNAQEAHEAIRPAGDRFRHPDELADLPSDERRLYELIWTRTVASQMVDAEGVSMTVRLVADLPGHDGATHRAELVATGRVLRKPGFLRAYVEGADDPDQRLEDDERPLPPLTVGDRLGPAAWSAEGHHTQPPARFTEASLVRALEERGIGRPSTYASIISTIQERGYVFRRGTALVPSFVAFSVVNLLETNFSHLVDYGFTASMEDDLDRIAKGEAEPVPWLRRFYFGDGTPGLHQLVADRLAEIDARAVSTVPIGTDAAGREVVVRVGRYGPYLQRGDDRAPVPEDLPPDELTLARAEELLAAGSEERLLGTDPATGQPVVLRRGRFGPYVQLGEANGPSERPRTASLLASMSPSEVGLEDALALLSLPRQIGELDGEPVVVANGRFGPYVKKGSETRSLASDAQLFTISLEEAAALLAAPKSPRGRRVTPPLRELGPDPESGRPIVLRSGRFGPYVTDGETNASLRRGDDPESIGLERAVELLAERRAAPATPRRTTRAGSRSRRTTGGGAGGRSGATRVGATRAGRSDTRPSDTGRTRRSGGRGGVDTPGERD
jgi:DNA topoisomerase-1